jgi:TonB family protein
MDEATFIARRLSDASLHMAAQPVQVSAPARVSQRDLQRTARRTVATATSASAAGTGCLGALVRWGIAFAIVYYAYTTIGRLPEVREAIAGLARGEQVDMLPATNAIRTLFGLSPAREEGARPRTSPSDSTADVYELGQPGVTAPTVVTRVPVRYPPEALRQQIQGTVILRCVVEPDGTVSTAVVVRSIDGRYGLDEEAVKAVKQWRFEPGRRNGVVVRVATPVSVTFTFRGRGNEQK